MKYFSIFFMCLSIIVGGCNEAHNDSNNSQMSDSGAATAPSAEPEQINEPAPELEPIKEKPKKNHNYSLKDGTEYGYEKGLSLDDLKAGKKAEQLTIELRLKLVPVLLRVLSYI